MSNPKPKSNDGTALHIWVTSLYHSQIQQISNEIRNNDFLRPYINSGENQEGRMFQIQISSVRKFEGNQADIVIWSMARAPEELVNTKSKRRGSSRFNKKNKRLF